MEISVTKCLILGAAGVGKTHLKHLLLKKDPPAQRISTGLADNPIRAISVSLAVATGIEEDDWFLVEDENALMSIIGDTIKGGGVSMASSMDIVYSTLPKVNVPSNAVDVSHYDPIPTVANTTKDDTQLRNIATDDLIHYITNSSGKE